MKYINNGYQCDVCLRCETDVKLITLMNHEQRLANKISEKLKIDVPFHFEPLVGCENCLDKIFFVNTLGRILRRRRNKIFINDRMHPHSVPTNEKEKKDFPSEMESISQQKEETAPDETTKTDSQSLPYSASPVEHNQPCTNDYRCTCAKCQNEFGALPILLEGIEIKAREQSFETQPSTSSGIQCNTSETKITKKHLTCQYCKKKFHHKGDYNKHLRKHTKEKPFTCSVCDRKFSHTSNLQRHLRLHSGQKPFSCHNCLKSFSRKDKLESHQKSRLCQKRALSSN